MAEQAQELSARFEELNRALARLAEANRALTTAEVMSERTRWLQARTAELRQTRQAAEDRAYALLLTYLTPAQHKQLKENGAFVVHGSEGGAFRLFNRFPSLPIEDIYTGWFYCVIDGSPEIIPKSDVTLARMFLIQTDEKRFRKIAIIY